MKNEKQIDQLNVENLTKLWLKASEPFSLKITKDYSYGIDENSTWPNRVWFHKGIDLEQITTLKETVLKTYPDLTLPCWDIYGNKPFELLEANGFVKQFEQTGMHLQINSQFEEDKQLQISRVETAEDAILWCQLFEAAFGYAISPNTLVKTHEAINYYIAYYQGKPVGTAMVYTADKVTGIHAMGIIPAARRRGLAQLLMHTLLNMKATQESDYVTLQASEKGKGLYLKLGFEERFMIHNYKLSTTE